MGSRILLLLLLILGDAFSQVPKCPTEITVPVGRLGSLVIDGTGGPVKWSVLGGSVDVFREYDPSETKVRLRVIGYAEGVAYLVCYSAKGDVPSDPATCVITIGTGPGPGPGPGPTPVPDPDPTLTAALQAAYAGETDAKKREYVSVMQAIYAAAGPLADASTNAADLFARLSAALRAEGVGVPKGAIPLTFRAVGDFLNAQLGTDPAGVLDKVKAKAVFARVAASLGRVK